MALICTNPINLTQLAINSGRVNVAPPIYIPFGGRWPASQSVLYCPPLPPAPPPTAVKPAQKLCSDSRTGAILDQFIEQSKAVSKAPFCYTQNQCETWAKRKVQEVAGLQDSRVVTLPFHAQIPLGSLVELDDDSGVVFIGIVYGVEINQTGTSATKTLKVIKYDPTT